MAFPIDWSTYAPVLEDIPTAQQTAEWELVRATSQAAFPDLDVRPGTPFADLFLIPAARQRAALRVATERLLSDLDLANLKEGVAYNCPFVEAYLASLGVAPDRIVPATGVLLLQFSSQGPFSFSASVLFGEGDTTLQVSGNYPSGSVTLGNDGDEDFSLFRLNETTWAAEVPVHGKVETDDEFPEPVEAGTALGVDTTIEGLSAAVTATAIDPGYPPRTLRERARLVPKLFPGLNTNTPAGLSAWVRSIFPSTSAASPVVDGDVEMTRLNPNNIFGLVDGKTDLYVRGHSIVVRTLTIPVHLENNLWRAELDAGSSILKVNGVRLNATGGAIDDYEVVTTSSSPEVLPVPNSGYSELEKLHVEFAATIPVSQQVIVTEEVPDAMVVEGVSGDGKIYRRDGSYTNKPQYTEVGGTARDDSLYWDGSLWQWSHAGVVSSGSDDAVPTPDSAVWDIGDSIEVRYATWADVDAAGIDRTTVPTRTATTGEVYAFFDVDVLLDPHVTQVREKLSRRDFAPSAGNVMVRPFVPVFLDKVKIFYRRNSGKEIRKAEAREEIVSYLNSSAYPDAPETGGLSEIAIFWGARGVVRVEYEWSAALTPASIQEDAGEVRTNVTTYTGADPVIPTDWAAGIGPRNTCPVVFPEAIEFYAVV